MEIQIILLNFIYAVIGALLTIGFMLIGYWVFDKITHFNTSEQLAQGNVAVGIVDVKVDECSTGALGVGVELGRPGGRRREAAKGGRAHGAVLPVRNRIAQPAPRVVSAPHLARESREASCHCTHTQLRQRS